MTYLVAHPHPHANSLSFLLSTGKSCPSLSSASLSRQLPLGKDSEEKIRAEAEVPLSEPLIWSSASAQSTFGLSHLHFRDLAGISWLECVLSKRFSSFFWVSKFVYVLLSLPSKVNLDHEATFNETVVWLA